MKILNFELGELVKLGPHLWADVNVLNLNKIEIYENTRELENKFVMYVEEFIPKKRFTPFPDTYHKILYDGEFYIITDNSYAVTEDSKRNLQKVLV